MKNKSQHSNSVVKPIKTRKSKIGYALAVVLILAAVIGSFLFFREKHWFKMALIAMPFAFLLFREMYRKGRLSRIFKTRFSESAPFTWRPESSTFEGIQKTAFGFGKIEQTLKEYNRPLLFIIEKRCEQDHQARLYEKLYFSLTGNVARADRFFHKGDMQVFWNEVKPNGLSLESFAQQFKDWLPVFCGDGFRALSPSGDDLQWWTYSLYHWENRVLLTNRPPEEWGHHERILKTAFTIIPFCERRFVIPEIDENDPGLIYRLENTLGKPITQWVAASALCSQLDWNLTLKIGKALSQSNNPLVTFENLQALSSLDWFRYGDIPEKTRQMLVDYLPEPLKAQIRQLIVDTLEESPPPAGTHAHNSFRMELAGLKAMIPGFPQKGIKNELYELTSIGYEKDILLEPWIDSRKWWIDYLIPKPLERLAYNEGSLLLGRSWLFFVPILMIFAGSVLVAEIPETEPVKWNWQTDFFRGSGQDAGSSSTIFQEILVKGNTAEGIMPLENAIATFYSDGYSRSINTNSNGRAGFEVNGKFTKQVFTLTVSKPGFDTEKIDIGVPANYTVSVLLFEEKEPSIGIVEPTGPVKPDDGSTIPATRVEPSPVPPGTDPPPGNGNDPVVPVTPFDDDDESPDDPVDPPGGPDTPPDDPVDDLKTYSVSGNVFDLCTGEGLNNAVVTIFSDGKEVATLDPWGDKARFSGTFLSPEVDKIMARVSAPNYETYEFPIPVNMLWRDMALKMQPNEIYGRVHSTDGSPVSNAVVYYDDQQYNVLTRGDGFFAIPGIMAGECETHVLITKEGFHDYLGYLKSGQIIELHEAESSLPAPLPPDPKKTYHLRGSVTHACSEEGLKNVKVSLASGPYQYTYDDSGNFNLEFEYEGTGVIALTIAKPGYHTLYASFNTDASGQPVSFRLHPKKIKGTLVNIQNERIGGVTVLYGPQFNIEVISNNNGEFEIPVQDMQQCRARIKTKRQVYEGKTVDMYHGQVIMLKRTIY